MAFQQLADGGIDGTCLGQTTIEKIAFHGSTPVGQRANAAQAAADASPSTNVSPFGFSQSQADGLVALVNELRAAMVEKGLIKGSA